MSSVGAAKKLSRARACSDCGHQMPVSRTFCPHCGRPQLFPNVELAKDEIEKQKLAARHKEALERCRERGCENVAIAFEAACDRTAAVFACPLHRLHREVCTGTEIYETYHDLERLRLRATAPGRFDWAEPRPQAEVELFGSAEHLEKIHYACLSIDKRGLTTYGDCTVCLAEPMIAHRASCFEGNSAVIYAEQNDFASFLRCEWSDRHTMCLATFDDRLTPATDERDFPNILVDAGTEAEDDLFIEVHVFGPMTSKTFESVQIDTTNHTHRDGVLRQAIEEKLVGVSIEVFRP